MKHILILFILLLPVTLRAQPYEHAAGIRAGYTSSINYKYFFIYRLNAIEADVGYNNHGLHISGLFEHHWELFGSDLWFAYLGGGMFVGMWDEQFSMGIAGVAGVEYALRKTPLNFGFDWRPMLNAYEGFDNDFLDFGLTVRYRFKI